MRSSSRLIFLRDLACAVFACNMFLMLLTVSIPATIFHTKFSFERLDLYVFLAAAAESNFGCCYDYEFYMNFVV